MAASRRASTANIFSTSKTNLKPAQVKEEPAVVKEVKSEPIKETKVENKVKEVAEPVKKEPVKETPAKEKSSAKTKKGTKKSDIFTTKKSHGKGCAKSIYLQGDVYEYLSEVAKEYELSLSDVVNQIVRYTMEGE